MRNKKWFSGINVSFITCHLLLVTCYFLFVTFLAACGRRSDPVAIEPRDERAVERKKDETQKEGERQEDSSKQKMREEQTIQITTPDSPAGLKGVYTQQSIVLTWDEVQGQDIKLYRIYRSATTGEGQMLVGETVTPAFTDKNVKPNVKYYYRITAMGLSEGLPSKEFQITTEVH